jgi:hypothetical protein
MIYFTCPSCRAGLRAPPGKAGAASQCPRCKVAVVVPVPARPAHHGYAWFVAGVAALAGLFFLTAVLVTAAWVWHARSVATTGPVPAITARDASPSEPPRALTVEPSPASGSLDTTNVRGLVGIWVGVGIDRWVRFDADGYYKEIGTLNGKEYRIEERWYLVSPGKIRLAFSDGNTVNLRYEVREPFLTLTQDEGTAWRYSRAP